MSGLYTQFPLVFAVALLCTGGCGAEFEHHPVAGKIVGDSATVANLSGSFVEAMLVSDQQTRASGEIEENGTFRLESLKEGEVLKGAPAGVYQLRIILSDDIPQIRNSLRKSIPHQYFNFEESGWQIQVPVEDEVILAVQRL